MAFGVARPTTATWPHLLAWVTASAAAGVATEVMPKMPFSSSPYLLMSVLDWLNDRMLSSCASTVSSHFIFGWHFAWYAAISEIQRAWLGVVKVEVTMAKEPSSPISAAMESTIALAMPLNSAWLTNHWRASGVELASYPTTLIPAARAFLSTGAMATGSFAANRMPSTPLVM